jgi:hypothetical protein
MDGRLAPGQTNPVDPPLAILQILDDILERKIRVFLGMEDQIVIMAVKTAPIAGRKEKDGNHFARPIRERGLDKSFDGIVHVQLSATSHQHRLKKTIPYILIFG